MFLWGNLPKMGNVPGKHSVFQIGHELTKRELQNAVYVTVIIMQK